MTKLSDRTRRSSIRTLIRLLTDQALSIPEIQETLELSPDDIIECLVEVTAGDFKLSVEHIGGSVVYALEYKIP